MIESIFLSLNSILDLVRDFYSTDNIIKMIQAGGLIGLTIIVFAETGLLVGFFLPGDSLLITAGILSSPHWLGNGLFSPVTLSIVLSVAAILGDQLNFYFGARTIQSLSAKPNNRLIKQRYFEEAEAFYAQHGHAAIVIARFIPILRTFVPFVAGAAKMDRRRFSFYNIVGGILWVNSMVWIGYAFGGTKYAEKLHHIILIVIVISFLPIIYTVGKRLIKSIGANGIRP